MNAAKRGHPMGGCKTNATNRSYIKRTIVSRSQPKYFSIQGGPYRSKALEFVDGHVNACGLQVSSTER